VKYYVFYRRDMMNSYLVTAATIEPDDYKHVVTVDIHAQQHPTVLERLFRIMNVVDGGADEIVGGGVHSSNLQKARIRSLSVGDLVIGVSDKAECFSPTLPGKYGSTRAIESLSRGYLCECSGWKSFTDTERFVGLQMDWTVFYDGLPQFQF